MFKKINSLKMENSKIERIINKMKIKSKPMKKFISLILIMISVTSTSTVINGIPKRIEFNSKPVYASEFRLEEENVIDGFHLLDNNKMENKNIINSLKINELNDK